MACNRSLSVRRRPVSLALLALVAGAVFGSGPPAHSSGTTGSRDHLEALTALGPRPSGSAANESAAEYLVAVLEGAGYQVEIQEGTVQSQGRGHQGQVRNVVAWLPATGVLGGRPVPEPGPGSPDAVLFAAHYDSIAESPGAADDAVSVAALLSVAAELPARARSRPVLFLLTDGEERGLLGAQLFVREHPLASRVGVAFNFDHSGRRPPLYAFETAPPNGALIRALARIERDSRPRAFSFAADLYRVLPFGTDFTVFRHLDVPGVNFAFVRDGYVYHTPFDRPEGVSPEALASLEQVIRSLAEDFVVAGLPLEGGSHFAAFFSLGPWIVGLGPLAAGALGWGAVLLGSAALLTLRRRRGRALGRGTLTVFLAAPLGVALLTGLVVLMQALAGRSQIAYAKPWWFLALLLVGGAMALPLAEALFGRQAAPGERLGAALALWSAVALLALLAAPSSLAFFAVPLLGLAGAGAAEALGARRGMQLGAVALSLALVAAVWVEPLATLLPFLVTTLALTGPEPLLLWPVVGAILGILLGSVGWGLLPAPASAAPGPFWRRRWAWVSGAVAVVVLGAVAVLTSPYGPEHPQRARAYHVTTEEEAYWALASADPLAGETLGRETGRETQELWWLGRRWHREIFAAEPAELPRVTVHRTASGLELEVDPPPGSDLVTLFVEGMNVLATAPPTDSERRQGERVGLREVVAEGKSARFALTGDPTPETELLVVSATPGLPETPPFAGRLGGSVAVAPRTLVYVQVPVPAAEGDSVEAPAVEALSPEGEE